MIYIYIYIKISLSLHSGDFVLFGPWHMQVDLLAPALVDMRTCGACGACGVEREEFPWLMVQQAVRLTRTQR